jgi:hypothetical protein
MPQEKARRQLQLETDMYVLFTKDPRADEKEFWANPRTHKHIKWCRKALDIFHLYKKLKADEHRTQHSSEKHQRDPQLRHDESQLE